MIQLLSRRFCRTATVTAPIKVHQRQSDTRDAATRVNFFTLHACYSGETSLIHCHFAANFILYHQNHHVPPLSDIEISTSLSKTLFSR